MLPNKIQFDTEYDINHINKTISEIIKDDNYRISNQDYRNIKIQNLTLSELRHIAYTFFVSTNQKKHPYFSQFSIANGIQPQDFFDWINNNRDVNYINMVNSIKKILINYELFPKPTYINAVEAYRKYNEKKKDYFLIISLDGDNLQYAVVPLLKNIIQNPEILIYSYYVNNLVPYYISYFQRKYGSNKVNIVVSYDIKKDASDVELQYVHNAIMTDAINNNLPKSSIVVTNDGYRIELKQLFDQLTANFNPFRSTIQTMHIYDPFRSEVDDKYWTFSNNVNVNNGYYIHSLRERSIIAFTDWIIQMFKDFDGFTISPEYQGIYQIIRNTESFSQLMIAINTLNTDIYEKYNLFSQYCVLTGSKFFSYSELRNILKDHYEYLNKIKLAYKIKGVINTKFNYNSMYNIRTVSRDLNNEPTLNEDTIFNPIYASSTNLYEIDGTYRLHIDSVKLENETLKPVINLVTHQDINYLCNIIGTVDYNMLFYILKEDALIALDIKAMQYSVNLKDGLVKLISIVL
jgi:hypothetical protein